MTNVKKNTNKNEKKYLETSMSVEHPYILLMKILTIFDYKTGIIQFENKNITANGIRKIMKINFKEFNKSFEILAEHHLAEITKIAGKKYIFINFKIVKSLDNAISIRKELAK